MATTVVFSSIKPAARLVVRGADAATFLQGQFTNDLARARDGSAIYGLWLNHKGRVLADSYVLARGREEFEVVSVTSPADVIRPRLESFIIADDVAVGDRTADSAGIAIAGAGGERVLEALGLTGTAPAVGEFAKLDGDGATVFRARVAAPPSWFLVLAAASASTCQERLQKIAASGLAREATAAELAASRIEAGVPEVPRELGPGDLPGEGGLEDEAISYTKGCYLGQEVMARLRNLGQVRRRLFVVRTHESTAAESSPLPAPLFAGGRSVGELRSLVAAADGGGSIGLAMLQLGFVQPGAKLSSAAEGAPRFEVVSEAAGRAW